MDFQTALSFLQNKHFVSMNISDITVIRTCLGIKFNIKNYFTLACVVKLYCVIWRSSPHEILWIAGSHTKYM
jgi:hypothetical protein